MSRGLAELSQRVGPTHRDVAELAQDLARIHYEDENLHKALYLFERAWSIWRVVDGKAGPNTLVCQQELALPAPRRAAHARRRAARRRDGGHGRGRRAIRRLRGARGGAQARRRGSGARGERKGVRGEEVAPRAPAKAKRARIPRRRPRRGRSPEDPPRNEGTGETQTTGGADRTDASPREVGAGRSRRREGAARRRAPLVKTTRGGPPWRPAGGGPDGSSEPNAPGRGPVRVAEPVATAETGVRDGEGARTDPGWAAPRRYENRRRICKSARR